MPEPLLANREPLCQVAKSKLLEVGVQPEPDLLYPFQLIRWGVEKGGLKPDPNLWYRQKATLEVLDGMEPEEALRFLTEPEPGWVNYNLEELSEMSPSDAAFDLLDSLHLRMAATLPDYP